MIQIPAQPIRVFYSYAHKDEIFRRELEKHLSNLRQQGFIQEWHDRMIVAGSDWAFDIDTYLNSSTLILLLISPDFMESDYCLSIEMTRAMELHKAGEAYVIPILLRPVDWEGAPFAQLEVLPSGAKPITVWEDLDQAFLNVSRGIRQVIEQLRISRQEVSAALQLKPIISYPREAQVGKTYLVSIDVQLATSNASWDFPEEEYTIGFILNTSPYFTCEPLHDVWPTIILHRYGGTYGPAKFLLTAAEHEIERGQISITLVNGWGIPMTRLELPCEVNLGSNIPEGYLEFPLPSRQEVAEPNIERIPIQVSSEDRIDHITMMLEEAGWTVIDGTDTVASPVTEFLTERFLGDSKIGSSDAEAHAAIKGYRYNTDIDFLLVVNRELIGIIAKEDKDVPLLASGLSNTIFNNPISSSTRFYLIYAGRRDPLPFIYEMQGEEIHFTNNLEPDARTRTIFHFHRPETFAQWLDQAPMVTTNDLNDLLRSRLRRMPSIPDTDLPSNQIEAITNLEGSLAQNRPRALIQMANSSAMIINSIYRLLEYGGAKQILYLVDSSEDTEKILSAFRQYTVSSADLRFIDVYNLKSVFRDIKDEVWVVGSSDHLSSIYIMSIDDIYHVLSRSRLEANSFDNIAQTNVLIGYQPEWPIEFFDVIFFVECFDELPRRYRPLLDYFDAFLVGVGGEIPSQVETLFNRNLVYQSPEMLAFKHILEGTELIENPYVPGLALNQHDPLFVGRTELIRRLDTALSSDHPPTFLLTGERRMGKSSILKQLPILLGSRYLPIFYDLQTTGITSSIAALLAAIAEEVHDRLLLYGMLVHKLEYDTLRNDLRENEEVVFHSFNRWLKMVERVLAQGNYVLLLMFDEFEKLAEAEQKGYLNLALLFDWFRSVIQPQSHVRLLFSGIKSITEMGTRWTDYFVNVELLKVSFLEPEEARQLIMYPVQSFPGEFIFGFEVTDEILRVTGNHPFLLQAMCSVLITRLNSLSRQRASIEDVTMAIEEILEKWGDSYFSDLWERTDSEQRLCLRAIYKSSGLCDANYIQRYCNLDKVTVASHLEKLLWRDLVCREGDKYRISTPIFSQWLMRYF